MVIISNHISSDIESYKGQLPFSIDLRNFIPTELVDCERLQGSLIEPSENIPNQLRKFVAAVKDHLQYFAAFSESAGVPVMRIAGTQKPVALWHQSVDGKGVLFCPPPLDIRLDENAFLAALIELNNDLTGKHDAALEPLPDWHSRYKLPEEITVSEELGEMQISLAELEKSISERRVRLDEIVFLKRLFSDKGDSLLAASGKAFTELGFSVSPGPIGRDDLILVDKSNNRFVVEVKGRDSRGAAEADAAQLEKWVSGFHHEHQVEPKGILVLNGFRSTPLAERNTPVFPDQMLAYVRRKELCLITGYQLLSLVLALQSGTISKEDIQKQILETVGTLPLFPNVSDCLSLLH